MRKSVCSLSIGYTRYLSYINIILYVWWKLIAHGYILVKTGPRAKHMENYLLRKRKYEQPLKNSGTVELFLDRMMTAIVDSRRWTRVQGQGLDQSATINDLQVQHINDKKTSA